MCAPISSAAKRRYMAREFKETSHLKVDKKKFAENFDAIDWGGLKEKPIEKKPETKRHPTTGICGEIGMSVFDKEAFDNNFDQIDWTVKPKDKDEAAEV